MKTEIKINKLCRWTQLIENVLIIVAKFNDGLDEWNIDKICFYVRNYDSTHGISLFNYSISKPASDTLEIYIDDELALSITMCEVHELKTTEVNY